MINRQVSNLKDKCYIISVLLQFKIRLLNRKTKKKNFKKQVLCNMRSKLLRAKSTILKFNDYMSCFISILDLIYWILSFVLNDRITLSNTKNLIVTLLFTILLAKSLLDYLIQRFFEPFSFSIKVFWTYRLFLCRK